MEDSALVAAAAQGDAGSFGELFARYESRLYNYAFRLAGNRDDALDISQEAFVKVFEALPRLVERAIDFAPYLYRTAHNAGIDLIRSRARLTTPEALEFRAEDNVYTDPERALLLEEQRGKVRDATLGLSENHRAVLALRELAGLSYDQIGEVLGMQRSAVGVALMRARLKLKVAVRMSYVDVDKLTRECGDMLPLLSAMIDDELSPAERERVESHLDECPLCRLALEQMSEASERYRAIVPLVPPTALGEHVLPRFGAHPPVVGSGHEGPAAKPGTGGEALTEDAGPGGAAGGSLLAGNVRLFAALGALGLIAVAGLVAYVLSGLGAGGAGGTRSASSVAATSAAGSLAATAAVTATPAATATPAPSARTAAADTVAPPTPELLSPGAGATVPSADPNVTLEWAAVSDPSGVTYDLQLQTFLGGGAGWGDLAVHHGIHGTNWDLTVDTPHVRWRVWAVDGAGNASDPSEWRTITLLAPDAGPSTQPTSPPAPLKPLPTIIQGPFEPLPPASTPSTPTLY